ncbi:hypothetical protein MASR2M78_08430 [Treponema sp.]
MKTIQTQADLDSLQSRALSLVVPKEAVLAVGLGTCGIGNGAQDIYDAIAEKLSRLGEGAPRLKKTGCFGFCAEEPMVSLYRPGKSVLLFGSARKADVTSYIRAAQDQKAADKLASFAYARIDDWDFMNGNYSFGSSYPKTPVWNETSFFKGQTKLVLRDAGLIDPESLDEYIAVGGYAALCKVLTTMDSRAVVEELSASGLRGRGGAGFPTGRKWELMRIQEGAEKWVICNADEGDPGAYMNRNEIESDPHMIIEGMAIGAYAMGARQGFIYIRAEYPLAVQRLNHAIEEARERGFLGEHIFGTDFSFDLEIVQGAGAFVCGEETALIASAEGRAGRSSSVPLPSPVWFPWRPYHHQQCGNLVQHPLDTFAWSRSFQGYWDRAIPGNQGLFLGGQGAQYRPSGAAPGHTP